MSQVNRHINPIMPPIRANKYFVYKEKKYPIDFCLIKKYSNYFYLNRGKFKSIDNIELKPENYEISDEAISIFIACCQNEPFDINNTNVFTLYQLSIQYDVPVLKNVSLQYINDNQKTLIFQSISYKLKCQNSITNIDLSLEEDTIASNFFEYINDDQLISLPVPVLYKIINNQKLNINSMNLTNQGQFIEFLFKCLDKHRREASVLFLNLDIENERIEVLSRLISAYSDVFDFNFINSKFLSKSATFLLSELQKQRIEFNNKISELESDNQKQKEFFITAQTAFNDSKSDLLNSNRSLIEKIADLERRLTQVEGKMNEQALQLERYTKVKVDAIEIECDSKLLEPGSTVTLNAIVRPCCAFNDGVEWKIDEEVNGTVNVVSMNKKTLTLKCVMVKKVSVVATALDGSGVTARKDLKIEEPITKVPFNSGTSDRFNGIVRHILKDDTKASIAKGVIGVSASTISSNGENVQPICALLKRNEKGSDYWYFHSKENDSDAWLCLDFKDKKVNPSHYSLKSYPGGNVNIINWNIEGSNDGEKWEILDSQRDSSALTSSNAEVTFEMKNKPHNDEYYRYLRIHQTGQNNNNDYRMIISSIEYFGSIK